VGYGSLKFFKDTIITHISSFLLLKSQLIFYFEEAYEFDGNYLILICLYLLDLIFSLLLHFHISYL